MAPSTPSGAVTRKETGHLPSDATDDASADAIGVDSTVDAANGNGATVVAAFFLVEALRGVLGVDAPADARAIAIPNLCWWFARTCLPIRLDDIDDLRRGVTVRGPNLNRSISLDEF